MRQATRPLQRRGAAGLRERLRLPQSEAPENEPITPELDSRPAESLHRTREIPGESRVYVPLRVHEPGGADETTGSIPIYIRARTRECGLGKGLTFLQLFRIKQREGGQHHGWLLDRPDV